MRDYKKETEDRVAFIREVLQDAMADGIVFGSSGGKDSALVGILCKKACENTIALIMPCVSTSNYGADMNDAKTLSESFNIETRTVDLTETAEVIRKAINGVSTITKTADVNIPPRLRMTTLYAVAASENRLVAGTGNKSEDYMGYFTKWGDGAFDFNPIADLTVTEIYEFLKYLGAPECFITRPPSAGLFDGQTDEKDMGVTYTAIDEYLRGGVCSEKDLEIIKRYHSATEHKRRNPRVFERN